MDDIESGPPHLRHTHSRPGSIHDRRGIRQLEYPPSRDGDDSSHQRHMHSRPGSIHHRLGIRQLEYPPSHEDEQPPYLGEDHLDEDKINLSKEGLFVQESFWSKLRTKVREPFAEFLGTMILILFGNGGDAQVKLGYGEYGQYQSISWAWAIGVTLGAVVASHGSAVHLNPAVTLANCVFRRFPLRKLPFYWVAQFLGAIAGAAIVYGVYLGAINNYEGSADIRSTSGPTNTANIYYTQAQPYIQGVGQFFSEFVATAILIIILFGMNDPVNNMAEGHSLFVLFLVIFGLGACFGLNTGYAINPARDVGPRLFAWFAQYGHSVWTDQGNYAIIPALAPFAGALAGGLIYDLLIYVGDSPVNRRSLGYYYFRDRIRHDPIITRIRSKHSCDLKQQVAAQENQRDPSLNNLSRIHDGNPQEEKTKRNLDDRTLS